MKPTARDDLPTYAVCMGVLLTVCPGEVAPDVFHPLGGDGATRHVRSVHHSQPSHQNMAQKTTKHSARVCWMSGGLFART